MKKVIGYILIAPLFIFLISALVFFLVEPFITKNVVEIASVVVLALGIMGVFLIE